VVTFVKEMGNLAKNKLSAPHDVAATVEAVFGCKWSLRILELIRQGVCRPGAIERALEGLTPKVQTYYFRRMEALGILDRVVYPEIPPRVEYHLTEFGLQFLPILDSIAELQRDLNRLGENSENRSN
jgi:DNA-binding HxlR family transcriptional regulator